MHCPRYNQVFIVLYTIICKIISTDLIVYATSENNVPPPCVMAQI